jgi:hypothetical protein
VSCWPQAVFHPTQLIDAIAQRMQRCVCAVLLKLHKPCACACACAQSTRLLSCALTPCAHDHVDRRPGGESRELWQALALLYKGQGRPDLSLAIYLQLQLPSVFDFIQV